MSTKQAVKTNNQATKANSSKSNEQEAQKGNAMATAEKNNTPAPEAAAPQAAAKPELTKEQKSEARYKELLAKDSTALGLSDAEEEEFLALRAARKKAVAGKRQAAADLVENYVKAGLSFADFATLLSDKSEALRAEVNAFKKPKSSTGKTVAGKSDRAELKKDLKSSKNAQITSIWLANPPKFILDEGAPEAFAKGASIDAWLVDPTDDKARDKFLYQLSKRTEFKTQPNKAQLGALWSDNWEKYSDTNKNKK